MLLYGKSEINLTSNKNTILIIQKPNALEKRLEVKI